MPADSAEFRDRAGKTLADYPRPSVAVDTAVLTLLTDQAGCPVLGVILVRHERAGKRAGWALPGTFLHERETLGDAVRRSLEDKAGIVGRAPEQLHVFDAPGRDDRGWVLSVAHVDALPASRSSSLAASGRARVVAVDAVPRLPYDHASIVRLAVARLRDEYATSPDPRGLIEGPFTVAEIRAVHEAVAGQALQKDTFRRSMLDALTPVKGTAGGRVGRPAQLYWPTKTVVPT